MKRLLILKTGSTLETLRASVGDFDDWIRQAMGLQENEVICTCVYLGQALPAIDELAGIVVTGSPAMVTDGARWNQIAMLYLAEAVASGLPILGICYGHQLLAQALGGQVDFHPQGREIGTVALTRLEQGLDDTLLGSAPSCFLAHTTHSQSVLRLPSNARVLARSEHDAHQCFRIGNNVWGVQFHPEFDAHIMRTYITERAKDLEAEGLDSEQILTAVRETPESTQLLKTFAQISGF